MKQEPKKVLDARQEARRRRRRRRRIVQACIILTVVLLLLLVGALVVLHIIGVQAAKKGEATSFLAVKAIQVEGETRYSAEELIEQSGLYVGQSLLAVNKVQAHDSLLRQFPYLSRVEIGNAAFDTLSIRVEETPVVGVVKVTQDWMVMGENNHALEQLTEDALPKETLQIVGATLVGEEIGKPLLDDRSLRICNTLIQAAQQYGLKNLSAIDITEKTNISLRVGKSLQVVLGNETNLAVQLQALVATLPTLYENNGKNADGRLDMTAYADDNPENDKSIYTPADLLIPDSTTTEAATDSTTASDGSGSADATENTTTTGQAQQ